ncbi:MAG TPA: hypothetical protein VF763_07620 [Candidatus Limnocylindrales bacterium]
MQPLDPAVPASRAAAVAGALDPATPLPGAPDPWAASDRPPLRDGPPYLMTEMIAAEPELARRVLGRLATGPAMQLATAIREAIGGGGHLLTTGCGTSEHAAQAAAEMLRDAALRAGLPAAGRVVAGQALELALAPGPAGLVRGSLLVAVSHEGGSGATIRALSAAREAGARTALVTVSGRSPAAALADVVLETGEQDESWCHTIGYLSPLLAAAAAGAALTGEPLDPSAVAGLLAAGQAEPAPAERLAAALRDARALLVVASGADRPAARELVLKVEEASWLPSAMRDLETLLHGHLPATDEGTGLVLLLADREARAERLERARQALAAAAAIGVRAGAILAAGADAALPAEATPAGRVLVPEAPGLPGPVAALLGTVTPLQLLTERLARARGTNPDPIRRDDPRYLEAAARADA